MLQDKKKKKKRNNSKKRNLPKAEEEGIIDGSILT